MRMVSRRASVLMGMTVLLLGGFAFAAPRALAQAPLPIRIGYQGGPDWLLYTARDLKLFEKEGLAPTLVKFVAGPPMIAAAESKSIDVSFLGIVPFLRGVSQGLDWVIIGLGEGAYAEGLVARKGADIVTLADLKGKRIGYLKGTTAHFGIMMTLRQAGMRADDVTLVDMPPAEQLAAMAKGDIDAAMVWEPWVQRMVREANGRVVAREGDLGILANAGGFSVRRDWLQENRETAVRFVRALLAAYDIVLKDRKLAIAAGAQEMGISETWVEAIYQDVPPPRMNLWTDPRYRFSLVKRSELHRRFTMLARFLLAEGIIPNHVDMSDILDASVIAEALRTRKQGQ